MTAKPPTQQLHDVLEGRVAWGDAPPSIQSWAAFFIYQAADGILKMPKEKRRSAIDRAPEGLRGFIEEEIKRLFAYSKSAASRDLDAR